MDGLVGGWVSGWVDGERDHLFLHEVILWGGC